MEDYSLINCGVKVNKENSRRNSISHFCSSPSPQFIYSNILLPVKSVIRYYRGKFNQVKDIPAILQEDLYQFDVVVDVFVGQVRFC